MSRSVMVAAAQMGPVARSCSRADVVERLLMLLCTAVDRGAELVIFPEVALTPFFPHWLIEDGAELEAYFEEEMPNPSVAPLFETARSLGVAFTLGFAELDLAGDRRRFNTSVLVSPEGRVVGRYRKIHLPGTRESHPERPFENLEKRYFDVGDLGLPTWEMLGTRIGMCLCNDRRWPETFRAMGLQGVELVALGYNTPHHNPVLPETDRLADFHNHLSLQAGAYLNSTWVVAAAKSGIEEGVHQIGGSCIVSPSGEIVARATTEQDEVIVAQADLELSRRYRELVFSPEVNRRPEHYGLAVSPPAGTPLEPSDDGRSL